MADGTTQVSGAPGPPRPSPFDIESPGEPIPKPTSAQQLAKQASRIGPARSALKNAVSDIEKKVTRTMTWHDNIATVREYEPSETAWSEDDDWEPQDRGGGGGACCSIQ